jgi:hypothetical protein
VRGVSNSSHSTILKNIETILTTEDHGGGMKVEMLDPKLCTCCDRPCKHGFPEQARDVCWGRSQQVHAFNIFILALSQLHLAKEGH